MSDEHEEEIRILLRDLAGALCAFIKAHKKEHSLAGPKKAYAVSISSWFSLRNPSS